MATDVTGIGLLTILTGSAFFLWDAVMAVREARSRASIAWRRGRPRRATLLIGGVVVLLGFVVTAIGALHGH